MKTIKIILLIFMLPFLSNAQLLRVSPDGHRLVNPDGSVFFYMSDTAWELFHRCSKEETVIYLKDRKKRGFNVIKAVILAEYDGLNTPNMNGDIPLIDNDPFKPNEAYFKHVDWVIKKAEEIGLVMAVLPSWGDKWNLKWGVGPVIFDTPEKSKFYHKYVAERYKNQDNIIWVLGGDRSPETPLQMEVALAMAEGVEEVDIKNHLMSFHTLGSSSSEFFQDTEWCDFNMAQTGHMALNMPIYEIINQNYNLKPAKPCLDGEPQYEDIPVDFKSDNVRFTSFDMRQAAYWTVLAGAMGYTYGNNNIWQMWTEEREPSAGARIPWQMALYQPGAAQMGYVRKIFESRPFIDMIPDQDILAKVFGQDKKTIRSARGKDYSFAIVYTPHGKPVHIDFKNIIAKTLNGYWYNPREGTSHAIEEFINTNKIKVFVPPSSGSKTDWVLIIDDKAKNYPDPATVVLD